VASVVLRIRQSFRIAAAVSGEAQIREQRGDLAGDVLVDAVQSPKGSSTRSLGLSAAVVSARASRSRSIRGARWAR
jgi:hypothetical protein